MPGLTLLMRGEREVRRMDEMELLYFLAKAIFDLPCTPSWIGWLCRRLALWMIKVRSWSCRPRNLRTSGYSVFFIWLKELFFLVLDYLETEI